MMTRRLIGLVTEALKSAWIRCEFSKTEIVNQIVLKLVGWRTQSYPVRISVDDKVVFTGNTERSLGYVTIAFDPTEGKSLKIELMGGANNRDAFGNIVEIPGTPDPNSAAGRKTDKDLLGIRRARNLSNRASIGTRST
jgi:hypothetical protein